MQGRSPSPSERTVRSGAARLLAPLALIAAVLAVAIVVASSVGDGGEQSTRASGGDSTEQTTTEEAPSREKRSYVVQPGDNLTAIAERFDLSVEEILDLNPDADPQALVTGQRLKLR